MATRRTEPSTTDPLIRPPTRAAVWTGLSGISGARLPPVPCPTLCNYAKMSITTGQIASAGWAGSTGPGRDLWNFLMSFPRAAGISGQPRLPSTTARCWTPSLFCDSLSNPHITIATRFTLWPLSPESKDSDRVLTSNRGTKWDPGPRASQKLYCASPPSPTCCQSASLPDLPNAETPGSWTESHPPGPPCWARVTQLEHPALGMLCPMCTCTCVVTPHVI